MIDSHCHLNEDALYPERKEIVERAKKAGVKKLLVVGWDLESSKKAVSIAEEFDCVYAAVGIHPENLEGVSEADLASIAALAESPKVIAIGEIGLDYHWFKDPKDHECQKSFFIAQIALANKLGLPCSIHARDASQDTFDILASHPIEKGCSLHCYSGSPEMLLRFAKLGCYFGFDGPVTFKNAETPKASLRACPLDRLLLETDSPYLAPTPYRGKRNEPSYVMEVAKAASIIKGLSIEEISDRSDENFNRIFHVKQ